MGIASKLQEGGGHKGVKFDEVGQSYTGTLHQLREQQDTDYATGEPLYWVDRKQSMTRSDEPVMTVILTLQTELNDGEDENGREDNGLRDVYCRSGLHTALQQALRQMPKGVSDEDLIGCKVTVTFDHDVPHSNPRFNARKVYVIEFGSKPGLVAAAHERTERQQQEVDNADIPFD